MKLHFEVISCSNDGSVHNVHIYTVYEDSDSHSSMALFLPKRYEAVERLQGEELIERKAKLFLGGDYNVLDDCLGCQGSTVTFPSPKDLVTLEHLRNHSGTTHTPE